MSAGGREAAEAASSETVEITSPLPTLPRLQGRVGRGAVSARVAEWRRDPMRLLFAPDGTLSRGLVFSVAVLFTLPTVDYFWKYESGAANLFFVTSITLTLAACLMLAFCRVLVVSVLVNAI